MIVLLVKLCGMFVTLPACLGLLEERAYLRVVLELFMVYFLCCAAPKLPSLFYQDNKKNSYLNRDKCFHIFPLVVSVLLLKITVFVTI